MESPYIQALSQGDVAIWSSGPYGHAMFVEDVYDNGTIFIVKYNFNFDGRYSEMVIPELPTIICDSYAFHSN